ncbi:hypothetical protein TNCV_1783661 [Trichonephila clavipes]|nr:hypothetical protein TNCV_1783661 [Trichonephila clavipes]
MQHLEESVTKVEKVPKVLYFLLFVFGINLQEYRANTPKICDVSSSVTRTDVSIFQFTNTKNASNFLRSKKIVPEDLPLTTVADDYLPS